MASLYELTGNFLEAQGMLFDEIGVVVWGYQY